MCEASLEENHTSDFLTLSGILQSNNFTEVDFVMEDTFLDMLRGEKMTELDLLSRLNEIYFVQTPVKMTPGIGVHLALKPTLPAHFFCRQLL